MTTKQPFTSFKALTLHILSHCKVSPRRLLFLKLCSFKYRQGQSKELPADAFGKTHNAALNCSCFIWHLNSTQLEQQHFISPTQIIWLPVFSNTLRNNLSSVIKISFTTTNNYTNFKQQRTYFITQLKIKSLGHNTFESKYYIEKCVTRGTNSILWKYLGFASQNWHLEIHLLFSMKSP